MKKRISTGIQVKKNEFISTNRIGKWVRTSDSQYAVKNEKLLDLYYKAETLSIEFKEGDLSNLVDNICDCLRGKEVVPKVIEKVTFLKYFKEFLDQLYKANQANTYRRYNCTYNRLSQYLEKEKIKLDIEDFSVSFLYKYEAFLKESELAVNTRSKEISILRTVLYRAIKEGIYPQEKNPFFGFRLKFAKSSKEKLTFEEVKRIEELELPNDKMISHVRNIWLFSLYNGGIRMGDLCRLKWSNISGKYLNYTMNKTSSTKTFELSAKSLCILNYYKPNDPNKYVFPLLKNNVDYTEFKIIQDISSKNTICNKHLKTIAKLSGITKKLSMHIARHSFADIARKRGVDIYNISKALAHSSIKVTEIYFRNLDQTSVDKSISNIFD